jgi:hypothetical protein
MPDLNLTDNAANLAGQLLDQLKADVLGTLTDPESIAGVEDAAHAQAAVQARVFNIINVVLTDAIKVGFGALKLALV